MVEQAEEFRDPSVDVVADTMFARLGLTDAAISLVCVRGILVLTADAALHLAIQHRGGDALNFNHVRSVDW